MSKIPARTSLAVAVAAALIVVLMLSGTSAAQNPSVGPPERDVRVVNGVGEPVPVQQQGESRVTVENLPAIQTITGTVGLSEGSTVGVASSEADPVYVQPVGGGSAPAVREPFQARLTGTDLFPCDRLFDETSNSRDIVIEAVTISAESFPPPEDDVPPVVELTPLYSNGNASLNVPLTYGGTPQFGGPTYGAQLHGPFHIGEEAIGGISHDIQLCISGGPESTFVAMLSGYYTS